MAEQSAPGMDSASSSSENNSSSDSSLTTRARSSSTSQQEINQALKQVLDLVEMSDESDSVCMSDLFDQFLTLYYQDSNCYLAPISVDKDYVGVHLGKVYEDNDLNLLLDSFRHSQILDAFYVLKIIKDAKDLLATMPNIRECVIESEKDRGVIVVGDLHGNFADLSHIIKKFGLPGHRYKFIFNGDYVDRGMKQIECLVVILHSFLIRPDLVFINRGNHEDFSMNINKRFQVEQLYFLIRLRLMIYFKPNFLQECRAKYGKYSTSVFVAATELFAHLPLATYLTNRVTKTRYFVVHGGVSDQTDLQLVQNKINRFEFTRLQRGDPAESKQICDLLWSDPISLTGDQDDENSDYSESEGETTTGCYFNKHRNIGSLFGQDVSTGFCQHYDLTCIIRSHQVRSRGYSQDHQRCLTIFSASNYCGHTNYGAVFEFRPWSDRPKGHRYKTKNTVKRGDESIVSENQTLIKRFKTLIQSSETDLLKRFERLDTDHTNMIDLHIWADQLSKHFDRLISPRHLIALKDYLCECETYMNLVNYRTMFKARVSPTSSNPDRGFWRFLATLFDMLDSENTGRVSIDRVVKMIKTLSKQVNEAFHLSEQECKELLGQLNVISQEDNMIDLDHFIRAFLDEGVEVSQTVHKEL